MKSSRLFSPEELNTLKQAEKIYLKYEGAMTGGEAELTFSRKVQAPGWQQGELTFRTTLPVSVTDYHSHKEGYIKPNRVIVKGVCDFHQIELLQAFIQKSDRVRVAVWMNAGCPAHEKLGLVTDEIYISVLRGKADKEPILVPFHQSACDPSIRLVTPIFY